MNEIPYTANADVPAECAFLSAVSAAESVALSKTQIAAVHSIEGKDAVVLAVLTYPIYLSSERAALKEEIECDAQVLCGKRVYLTFDMEIFRKLDASPSPEETAELFTKVTEGREVF